MVYVRMGHEDVRHHPVRGGPDQVLHVRRDERSGVDHRHLVARAHHEGGGPVQGVRPGVVRDHPLHERRQAFGLAVDDVVLADDEFFQCGNGRHAEILAAVASV